MADLCRFCQAKIPPRLSLNGRDYCCEEHEQSHRAQEVMDRLRGQRTPSSPPPARNPAASAAPRKLHSYTPVGEPAQARAAAVAEAPPPDAGDEEVKAAPFPLQPKSGRCRYCGGRIGTWGRLRGQIYCSEKHQELFRERQTALMIERLASAVDQFHPPVSPKPDLSEAPESAAGPPAAARPGVTTSDDPPLAAILPQDGPAPQSLPPSLAGNLVPLAAGVRPEFGSAKLAKLPEHPVLAAKRLLDWDQKLAGHGHGSIDPASTPPTQPRPAWLRISLPPVKAAEILARGRTLAKSVDSNRLCPIGWSGVGASKRFSEEGSATLLLRGTVAFAGPLLLAPVRPTTSAGALTGAEQMKPLVPSRTLGSALTPSDARSFPYEMAWPAAATLCRSRLVASPGFLVVHPASFGQLSSVAPRLSREKLPPPRSNGLIIPTLSGGFPRTEAAGRPTGLAPFLPGVMAPVSMPVTSDPLMPSADIRLSAAYAGTLRRPPVRPSASAGAVTGLEHVEPAVPSLALGSVLTPSDARSFPYEMAWPAAQMPPGRRSMASAGFLAANPTGFEPTATLATAKEKLTVVCVRWPGNSPLTPTLPAGTDLLSPIVVRCGPESLASWRVSRERPLPRSTTDLVIALQPDNREGSTATLRHASVMDLRTAYKPSSPVEVFGSPLLRCHSPIQSPGITRKEAAGRLAGTAPYRPEGVLSVSLPANGAGWKPFVNVGMSATFAGMLRLPPVLPCASAGALRGLEHLFPVTPSRAPGSVVTPSQARPFAYEMAWPAAALLPPSRPVAASGYQYSNPTGFEPTERMALAPTLPAGTKSDPVIALRSDNRESSTATLRCAAAMEYPTAHEPSSPIEVRSSPLQRRHSPIRGPGITRAEIRGRLTGLAPFRPEQIISRSGPAPHYPQVGNPVAVRSVSATAPLPVAGHWNLLPEARDFRTFGPAPSVMLSDLGPIASSTDARMVRRAKKPVAPGVGFATKVCSLPVASATPVRHPHSWDSTTREHLPSLEAVELCGRRARPSFAGRLLHPTQTFVRGAPEFLPLSTHSPVSLSADVLFRWNSRWSHPAIFGPPAPQYFAGFETPRTV